GLPVGGVVATDAAQGVVRPGAIGFDINCGVRLLATDLTVADLRDRVTDLVEALYAVVPTGVGSHGVATLEARELSAVMEGGAGWAVERGQGFADDVEHLEPAGRTPGPDPASVSERARERGRRQLGTLGSGNHFLE